MLEAVRVAEDDLGERSTTSRVVDDLADDALDVSIALREVERAELGGTLAVGGVGAEDATSTLPLTCGRRAAPRRQQQQEEQRARATTQRATRSAISNEKQQRLRRHQNHAPPAYARTSDSSRSCTTAGAAQDARGNTRARHVLRMTRPMLASESERERGREQRATRRKNLARRWRPLPTPCYPLAPIPCSKSGVQRAPSLLRRSSCFATCAATPASHGAMSAAASTLRCMRWMAAQLRAEAERVKPGHGATFPRSRERACCCCV